MTAHYEHHHGRSGLLWLALLILAAIIILFVLPAQLPALQQVRTRPHAVQHHGQDALDARQALFHCGEGLHVRLCPPSSRHGLSVVFWCETGGSCCPGMYVTIGGVEKTCFYRSCDDWRHCR